MDYTLFYPQFGSFLITVLAFIFCLSIIVFVHEFGHYFIGKLSGIHAEVFSIGFGPVLLSFHDKKGTKWQIAAFPFGGFVKFLGDKNSASVPELEINSDNQIANHDRASMHGAPLWARFVTVAAGPVFNFIFSGFIFFIIFLGQGTTKIPLTVGELFGMPYETKLRQGDVIVSINNIPIEKDFNELSPDLIRALSISPATYIVERDNQLIQLNEIIQNPPRIYQVLPKSAAIASGLKIGDVILSINFQQIDSFEEIKGLVESSEGQSLNVEFWRKGVVKVTTLKPLKVDVPNSTGGFESIYRVGIVGGHFPFDPVTERQSLGQAINSSIESVYKVMEGSIKGLYHILFGNISSCNLSGPISIAETSGQMVKQGGLSYLWFIAVLSTAIGLINLFPIPVLDGGHLMFFTCEAVLGKKLDPRIMSSFMTIGLMFLVILMLFALFNDFFCP